MEKDRELRESALRSETLMRNVSIAGVCVLLLLTGILFRRYQYKKRTTEQLNATLTQLRSTQSQLIHAEKMATLGEMTAGIAHEIRNPLNFVTNFSSLSAELADELAEHFAPAGTTPVQDRAALQSTVGALRSNLDKVMQHARRADSIVVHGHGGTLTFTSDSSGAEFIITLPAAAPA